MNEAMSGTQATVAFIGGWALAGVVVLTILAGALARSERLLVVSIGAIEVLLLIWVVSLWWSLA